MKHWKCTYSFMTRAGEPYYVGQDFYGATLDRFTYAERRFFKEVPNEEGVALQDVDVSLPKLTSKQVLASVHTPQTIIPAPGVGKRLNVR